MLTHSLDPNESRQANCLYSLVSKAGPCSPQNSANLFLLEHHEPHEHRTPASQPRRHPSSHLTALSPAGRNREVPAAAVRRADGRRRAHQVLVATVSVTAGYHKAALQPLQACDGATRCIRRHMRVVGCLARLGLFDLVYWAKIPMTCFLQDCPLVFRCVL